jgi:4-hydroxy-2-oxoheptanedioate aldolase
VYETPVEDTERRAVAALGIRELWAERDLAVGGWCAIPSPFVAEVLATVGFDWICLDLQHGLIGYETMVAMLQAVARRAPVLVRVPWNEPDEIMRPLDAGAAGVIVPMVNSAEETDAAVRACRYAPEGFRSWGPTRASLGDPDFGPAAANRDVVCAIMIETVKGVENVGEILAVPGVDVVLIGPNDLSLSETGTLGASEKAPRDRELIGRVLDACGRAGVVVATSVGTLDDARQWLDLGVKMIGVSDVGLLGGACVEALRALRPTAP